MASFNLITAVKTVSPNKATSYYSRGIRISHLFVGGYKLTHRKDHVIEKITFGRLVTTYP